MALGGCSPTAPIALQHEQRPAWCLWPSGACGSVGTSALAEATWMLMEARVPLRKSSALDARMALSPVRAGPLWLSDAWRWAAAVSRARLMALLLSRLSVEL